MYLCVYTHIKFQKFCNQYDLNINHLKIEMLYRFQQFQCMNVQMWYSRDSSQNLAMCFSVLPFWERNRPLLRNHYQHSLVLLKHCGISCSGGGGCLFCEDWKCSLGFDLVGTHRKLQENSAYHQNAESSVWFFFFLMLTLVSLMKTRAVLVLRTGRKQGPEGGEQARGWLESFHQ